MDQVLLVSLIVGLVALAFLAAPGLVKLGRSGLVHRQPRLFRLLPDAVIGVAPSGAVRTLNRAAEELFGHDQAKVRGLPLSTFILGATAFRPGTRSNEVSLPASTGIETDAIRKDGSIFPVRCLPLGRSFLMVTDRTDSSNARTLETRLRVLTSAIQLLPSPILIATPAGRVLMFNQACQTVIGPTLSEGMPLNDLFPSANGAPPFEHRSGYVFTAPAKNPAVVDCMVLSGHKGLRPDQIRRCEDLLTEVNGHSELLLEGTSPADPIREDLEHLQRASAEAIDAFHKAQPP